MIIPTSTAASLILTAFFALGISNAGAACTGSSPAWYSTPDRDSVAACVSAASSGDTITVSAGTARWASAVSWTGKNLTLAGAGIGNTKISGNMSVGQSENPPTNSSRITGFSFTDGGSITIAGRGWRIDHNSFSSSSFAVAVWIETRASRTAQHKGLIDNNTFTLTRVLAYGYPGTSQTELNGTNQWSTPLALGTDEAVYVEDNTFKCASPCINVIDGNDGGRFVFRFNTVTDGYVEAHGVAAYRRATRKWEIYYNTFGTDTKSTPFVTLLRAGTGMVFNNTAMGRYGQGYTIDHRRSTEYVTLIGLCNGGSSWDRNDNPPHTGWLCRDQIGAGIDVSAWSSGFSPPAQEVIPAYFFSNTHNGATSAVSVINRSDVHVVVNRNYYDYNASFTGTSGVGVGPYARRPATCTAGVGYWATDEGEWNSLNGGYDGRFYKCSATNTWTLYYTPYAYPHPLRNAGLVAPPPQPSQLSVH
jgi:hypothetical protein